MRRRLELLIPIVLLAILVQLFAPIAAFRAVAYAVNDPLYMASICSGMGSDEDAQTAPVKTQHDHGDCCAFCAAGHGGAAAVEPPALVFVASAAPVPARLMAGSRSPDAGHSCRLQRPSPRATAGGLTLFH